MAHVLLPPVDHPCLEDHILEHPCVHAAPGATLSSPSPFWLFSLGVASVAASWETTFNFTFGCDASKSQFFRNIGGSGQVI